MDDFVKKYLADNKINDLDDFREKTMNEFYDRDDSRKAACSVAESNMECPFPDIEDACKEHSAHNPREVKGLMMAYSAVRFTHFINQLWSAVDKVQNTINNVISAVVSQIVIPADIQTWTKIMSIAAAVTGLIIAAAVVIQILVPEGAPTVAAGFYVGGSIALSNAFAWSAAAGALKEDPGQADVQLKKVSHYNEDAFNELEGMKDLVSKMMSNKNFGQKNIHDLFKGGHWLNDELWDTVNKNGFDDKLTAWFRRLIVAEYVTKAFRDIDAYIIFVPYDEEMPYLKEHWKFDKDIDSWAGGEQWGAKSKKKGPWGFHKEHCEKYFKGNKGWKYSADCDMTFGPGGRPGMSMISRPSKEGSESQTWLENPITDDKMKISTHNIMKSAIYGQQQHGFNFSITQKEWSEVLDKDKGRTLRNVFSRMPDDEPGLYPLPVCVVHDLVNVPGIEVVMNDFFDSHFEEWYPHSTTGPCSCAKYEYTPEGGKKGRFMDFITKNAKKAIGDKCKVRKGDEKKKIDT
ncbi:hypothetical protein N7492_000561 [Penicillium capsulatum]|uniref:Uncharacterized protein n=1 Tax=Penicillium capsulatum TaxID=69766 RepID=A0A9W9IQN5_9EURO|nr:hypothetical protein N7492_000561 [Penicillium capsulatum]